MGDLKAGGQWTLHKDSSRVENLDAYEYGSVWHGYVLSMMEVVQG
jgi:hypothetical protein